MFGFGKLTSSALALALVAGSCGFATTPVQAQGKPAKPAKISMSKGFLPLAMSLNKAIETAKTRPDVVSANAAVTAARNTYNQTRGSARTQAKANYDAALAALKGTVAAEATQLDTAFAAIANPDDRFTFGQLAIQLGSTSQDMTMQRRGLTAMLESGKPSPVEAARFNYFLGQFAMEQGDNAAAVSALQAAVSGGYLENDSQVLLAEAYIANKQAPQGLAVLQQAITARNATANKAPVSWYRRGIGASYSAKLLDQAVGFSTGLVQAYPTTDNWAAAIQIVREIGKFPLTETLDLMRLMGRTNSFLEERDYVEYIQSADPRQLPGEVIRVLDAGLASGKLRSADMFVTEARTIAGGRLAADKASLPGYERDAKAPTAALKVITGAADAFLSYGEAAKAEALYNAALTKPGVDLPRTFTRLGIAQVDQGNYAGAMATFAKVEGPRKQIAQLWAAYAQYKAQPAAGASVGSTPK